MEPWFEFFNFCLNTWFSALSFYALKYAKGTLPFPAQASGYAFAPQASNQEFSTTKDIEKNLTQGLFTLTLKSWGVAYFDPILF